MTTRHRLRLRRASGRAVLILMLGGLAAWAADMPVVTQAHRKFQPQEVEVARGGTIRFVNDDGQLLHHIYSTSSAFSFDSGEQEPGKAIEERFPVAGTFTVLCGIHPKMRLSVTVR